RVFHVSWPDRLPRLLGLWPHRYAPFVCVLSVRDSLAGIPAFRVPRRAERGLGNRTAQLGRLCGHVVGRDGPIHGLFHRFVFVGISKDFVPVDDDGEPLPDSMSDAKPHAPWGVEA